MAQGSGFSVAVQFQSNGLAIRLQLSASLPPISGADEPISPVLPKGLISVDTARPIYHNDGCTYFPTGTLFFSEVGHVHSTAERCLSET